MLGLGPVLGCSRELPARAAGLPGNTVALGAWERNKADEALHSESINPPIPSWVALRLFGIFVLPPLSLFRWRFEAVERKFREWLRFNSNSFSQLVAESKQAEENGLELVETH